MSACSQFKSDKFLVKYTGFCLRLVKKMHRKSISLDFRAFCFTSFQRTRFRLGNFRSNFQMQLKGFRKYSVAHIYFCCFSHCRCQYCGWAFITVQKMREHEYTHTGEKPYQCKYCPKSFRTGIALKSHERLHTGERPYRCTVSTPRATG